MSVVVSDMYSVVLDAGIQAAIAAGTSGPSFNITGFQIGSLSAAQGAVASATATGVDNWVYTGTASQIYYALLPDSDACLFRIILDESVGNFQVGQICLMIGSTAFSKSILYQQQNKWKSALPGLYGNSISFDIVLAISDAQACINLSMFQSLYAMLPEVADETLLPAASSTLYNTYLVRNHTALGVPVVANARNSLWYFAPHRTTAAQGEGVMAVSPALFDPTVQMNMAVYFDYTTGLYLPADPMNETKFPVGVMTSACEITQIGYISRFGAGTADDIWPTTLTVNEMYSVQAGQPGIPGISPTYQPYGVALSNNLIYIDMVDKRGESWINQATAPAGAQPLDQSHKHVLVTEAVNGFMIASDKLKLDNPVNFVIGSNGINTTALPGGKVSVQPDGTTGFPIPAGEPVGPGILPGAPVCLQITGGTRTWIAADPRINALRPIGILSNDSTRVILSGYLTLTATPNAWPMPLASNGLYFAGEDTHQGTVQASGNWIVGSAVNSNTLALAFDPLSSILDHINAFTATTPVAVRGATPAGVAAMFAAFFVKIADPVTGFLPLAGGTMTGPMTAEGFKSNVNNISTSVSAYAMVATDNGKLLEVGGMAETTITCQTPAVWSGGVFYLYNGSTAKAHVVTPAGLFVGPSGSLANSIIIPSGSLMFFMCNGVNIFAAEFQQPISSRTVVFAPQTTWYVNFGAGSDSTGDGKTAGTAWATIQHAINYLSVSFIAGQIRILCANGTLVIPGGENYAANFQTSQISGWILEGNIGNPAACVIDASAYGARGIANGGSSTVVVNGFTIYCGQETVLSEGNTVYVGNVNIIGVPIPAGGSSNAVAFAAYGGKLTFLNGANISLSGPFSSIFCASLNGYLLIGWHDYLTVTTVSINLQNPYCYAAFIYATDNSSITYEAPYVFYSGAAFGTSYIINQSVVNTYGAGAGVIPGSHTGYIIGYGSLL